MEPIKRFKTSYNGRILNISIKKLQLDGANHILCTLRYEGDQRPWKGNAILGVYSPNDVCMAKTMLDGETPDKNFVGIWNVEASTLAGAGENHYDILQCNELHLAVYAS